MIRFSAFSISYVLLLVSLLTRPRTKPHSSSHLLATVLRSSSLPPRRVSGDTPSEPKSPGRRKWLKIWVNNAVLLSAGLIILPISVEAKGKKRKAQPKPSSGLSTEFVFDDSVMHGKYQYSGESVSVVENEKILNSLLGVRRDFRDRLSEEKKRK